MDAELTRRGHAAVEAVEEVLRLGPSAGHRALRAAANGVIAFRNHAIEAHRHGSVPRELLDRANALTSLAFGAEFPLSGMHMRRLEEVRDEFRGMLDGSGR